MSEYNTIEEQEMQELKVTCSLAPPLLFHAHIEDAVCIHTNLSPSVKVVSSIPASCSISSLIPKAIHPKVKVAPSICVLSSLSPRVEDDYLIYIEAKGREYITAIDDNFLVKSTS